FCLEASMLPIGPIIVSFVGFAVVVYAAISLAVHAFVPRFWLACTIVTTLVLAGCAAVNSEAGFSDALSLAMLYGIGGASGLALAILTGLPFARSRRLAACDEP